jgi:uncharacterized protein YcaQ
MPVRRLGCIQIDTIQAVRRSHELALMSRGIPANQAVVGNKPGHEPLVLRGVCPRVFYYPVGSMAGIRMEKALDLARGPKAPMPIRTILNHIDAYGSDAVSEIMSGHSQWDRATLRLVCEWLLAAGRCACTARTPHWAGLFVCTYGNTPTIAL